MARIKDHAEDICLALGALCAATGVAVGFGYAFGLITLGVLLITYGVWITERRH